jgi:hypothetical protein
LAYVLPALRPDYSRYVVGYTHCAPATPRLLEAVHGPRRHREFDPSLPTWRPRCLDLCQKRAGNRVGEDAMGSARLPWPFYT